MKLYKKSKIIFFLIFVMKYKPFHNITFPNKKRHFGINLQ